jgi:hypothetical protein
MITDFKMIKEEGLQQELLLEAHQLESMQED